MIFEIGLPRKTFTSKEDALNFINLYNGKKKALFQSVYNFTEMRGTKPNYETAIVDKLFFDFDAKSDCWKECNKLHQYLLQENIKHIIIWSGRGYHLLILTSPLQLKNCKSAIYNSQISLINKLSLICDRQVIGDHSRLRRIPNSYHPKAERFCIFLTKADFDKGYEHCKELARKQNSNKEYIGENLFDISEFDYKTEKIEKFEFETEFEDSANQDYMNNCPPFITQLLLKKDCGWQDRYLIILFFKEKGYTIKEVMSILKENLTKRKFKHCILEERQLQYLFERDDLVFPEKYCKVYK